MTYKLSPSTLSLLKDCPRCFWLKFNKGIKRPAGIFPSLPSGMDKILKEHFDRFMEKGEMPPELKEQDCVKECKLFDDKEQLKIWRSNFKGIQHQYNKDFLIRGAVDNILIKGKKLIVLDYKTRGYPLKEDTHTHYQDQMDIYNYLLRKNNYKTEDFAFLIFYFPTEVTSTGEVVFDTVLKRMKVDVGNAEGIIKKAVKVLKGRIPKADKECGWCRWAEKLK